MSSENENGKNETDKKEDIGVIETFKILLGASKGFWLVNMVNFGDGICYFGILTLLTRFLGTRVGMTEALTGVSVSMFTGFVTLFMFGGGFISDKLGVRKALTWSLLILGIGRVFLTIAPEMGTLLTAQVFSWMGLLLMALATGVLQPALYAGVKEYTDPRTATIGYGLLYAIMNLGIVAENFISPFIRSDKIFLDLKFTQIIGLGWGIDGVFWICTALTGVMLLVHMSFFTKKVEDTEMRYKDEKAEDVKRDLTMKERLKELPFLDVRFIYFIFILLPVRTLFAHQFLTMPDYVFRAFPEAVGAKFEWINGLNPLIIVIFVPLFAALTREG